jgi:serine/threonine-protein kinase
MSREALPVRWGGYLLLKRLATGGMAEVYLAVEEPRLGGRRFVVVKRVRDDYESDPEYAQYFLTEGRISLKCHHPNLPVAHHLGTADHRAFLVLEFLEGHAAVQLLRALAAGQRGLDVGAAVAIGLGVARALEHLHALADLDGTPLAVVHRDVSPHNIVVTSGGGVKLIDLGIARASLQTHHTETGVVKGKYAYMAPEQLDTKAVVDARADLFALGAVLHELLVGRALFQGASDLDTCDRVRAAPIPDPCDSRPDLPRTIADVVLRALARDPDVRFSSAAELARALEDAAAATGVWPSATRLWAEVTALLGAAPRPELEDGALVWRDAPARAPRVYPRASGEGTVMEVIAPEPTEKSEPPEGASTDSGDAGRRDPSLAYYLHVGAPDRDDDED